MGCFLYDPGARFRRPLCLFQLNSARLSRLDCRAPYPLEGAERFALPLPFSRSPVGPAVPSSYNALGQSDSPQRKAAKAVTILKWRDLQTAPCTALANLLGLTDHRPLVPLPWLPTRGGSGTLLRLGLAHGVTNLLEWFLRA